jgi:hypothetical protein
VDGFDSPRDNLIHIMQPLVISRTTVALSSGIWD